MGCPGDVFDDHLVGPRITEVVFIGEPLQAAGVDRTPIVEPPDLIPIY
jgi:hypothetical protein